MWPVVKAWLSGQQQAWVEEYAPERIELPGGRKAKITYTMDGPPTVAARIQDLYGVKEGCGLRNGACRCESKCWRPISGRCR